MVRTKKKKAGSDFTKIKQKVGGRKLAPANETRTEFRSKKINVPAQLQGRPDDPAQSNLNIADLLAKTQHYNSRERRQALDQLRRVLQKTSSASSITNIVRVVARLTLDDDRGVRRALHAVLRCVDFTVLAPFAADQLHRFVLAAMTHPSMMIRVDGLIALDAIIDAVTADVREPYLSALIAAFSERTATDALGIASGAASAALRCCLALLSLPTTSPIGKQTDRSHPALLHTPDPFQRPGAAPPPLSSHLLLQISSALIESALESAGHNPASLSLCVQGLYVCAGNVLPATIRDRIDEHIVPMFSAPFADSNIKLQICRLMAALQRSLPDPMMMFLSRSLSMEDQSTVPCDILLLHDQIPVKIIDNFVHALRRMTPSSSALDVCHKFLPQFPPDTCDLVLNLVRDRFIPCPDLTTSAITLLLDAVRSYPITRFDPIPLLNRRQLGAIAPADQARIVALFGYVDITPDALPTLAATLCSSAVTVPARSLLLELVPARAGLPTTDLLSLLVTVVARAETDDLQSVIRSSLTQLNVRRPGTFAATFDAILRLLGSGCDRDVIRRLVLLAEVCIDSVSSPERLIPYLWSVWEDGADRDVCTKILLARDVMAPKLLSLLMESSPSPDSFISLLETEALRPCWRQDRGSIDIILKSIAANLTEPQRHHISAEMSLIFGMK